MKLGFAGGGSGKGFAVDTKNRKETVMKMIEAQADLGLGIQRFRLVWVFDDAKALARFIDSGWELGGQVSAAAKAGEQGTSQQCAVAVSPGVWLYPLADDGLALGISAKGSKYYKDADLN